jgi:glutamyl-tRNA reductase
MELFLVGLNHKSAPLALREKLAAVPAPEALAKLREAGFSEAVVLSTCNRFELYASERSAERHAELSRVLDGLAGAPLNGEAYSIAGPAAIRHLFSVSAGLDSLVVGEGEILGQVKAAYELARQAGMTGKLTNMLFQRAVFAAKHARTTTGIAHGHTSVATVAVELAERIFGPLTNSEVLIVGAGQMAELSAKYLVGAGVKTLRVCNRTAEKAAALAARFKGAAVAWEELNVELGRADIVVTSTGADRPVVTLEMARRAIAGRRGRPLFLIDIAMPRDVEEAVHDLDQVYLYTLKDLDAVVQENLASRAVELEKVRRIAHDFAGEFSSWLEARLAGRRAALRHNEA